MIGAVFQISGFGVVREGVVSRRWAMDSAPLVLMVLLIAVVSARTGVADDIAPTRIIELPVWEDGHQWARDRRLTQWRIQPGSGSEQYVISRMGEPAWQGVKSVCKGGNRCFADTCQRIRNRTAKQGWLLSVPPNLEASLAGESPGCPEMLEAWQDQWPDLVPASCWALHLGSGCDAVVVPGPYLKPQARPGHVLVLLPDSSADRDALQKVLNVQLQDTYRLESLDGLLLDLYMPDHSRVPAVLKQLQESFPSAIAQPEYAYFPLIDWSLESLALPAGTGLPEGVKTDLTFALIGTGTRTEEGGVFGSSLVKEDLTGQGHLPGLLGDAQVGLIAQALSGAQLQNYQVCSRSTSEEQDLRCWNSSLIKALDRALARGADIVQIGIGGPESAILKVLVHEALRRENLVLSGVGDGGPGSPPIYPAAWPEVEGVTAVDRHGRLFLRANRGDYISLAAPGVNWPLSTAGGPHRLVSGTALAAAYVGAAVAQLSGVKPESTVRQVFNKLLSTSDDVGPPGADRFFGGGLINRCRLLSQSDSMRLSCPSEWETRSR